MTWRMPLTTRISSSTGGALVLRPPRPAPRLSAADDGPVSSFITGARRASGRRQSTVLSPACRRRGRVRGGQHRALARARDHAGQRSAAAGRVRPPPRGRPRGPAAPPATGTSAPPGSRWPGTSAGSPGRAPRRPRRPRPRRPGRRRRKPPGPPRARPSRRAPRWTRPAKPEVAQGGRAPAPADSRPRTRPSSAGGATRAAASRARRSSTEGSTSPMVSAPVVQAAMHCAQSMQRCSSTIGRPSTHPQGLRGAGRQAGAAVPAPVRRGVERDGRRREGDLRAAGRW